MKTKILSLLLFLSFLTVQAQVITPLDVLKLRYNAKKNSATRVMVQDSITGVCGWILKSSLSSGGTSLPSQTGNSGKFLTTNGTTPSWATVPTPNLQAVTNVSPGTQITNPIYSSQQIASYNTSTNKGAGLSENGLVVAKDATNAATINADLLTATRTQQLPNKSGTFAMTSDIDVITFDTTLANGNTATDRIVKLRNTGEPSQKADIESYQARFYDTTSTNESLITPDGIHGYTFYSKNTSIGTDRLICDELGGILTYGSLNIRNEDFETTALGGTLYSNVSAARHWYMPDHDGTLLTDADMTLDSALANGNISSRQIILGTDFSDGLTLDNTMVNLQGSASGLDQQSGISLDNFYVNATDTGTGNYYEALLSAIDGLHLHTGTDVSGSATLKSDLTTGTRILQLPDESGTLLTGASAASTYAPKASPTFTGTATLPSSTSIGTVSSTEIGYVDGVTSAIQTQLNNKPNKASITGATKTKITYNADGIVTSGADLSASDLPTSIDATKLGTGVVSNTELGYLDGVTSAIQTQIDSKAAKADYMIQLTAYAGANSTSAQKMFNVGTSGNGSFNAVANTTYRFRLKFNITGISSTSGTLAIGFGGTATVTSIDYDANCAKAGSLSAQTSSVFQSIQTTASTIVTAANTNTAVKGMVNGIIRVSTAGTIIPQYTTSAGSSTVQTDPNSYFEIVPIGSDTMTATSNIN